jgi:diaminohydroxyphosphoribosylaminopyrimidine deaminase/5-amino-6-(5-phosphoribosylamino)uracil reductase
VAGQGLARLKAAGIEVAVGVGAAQARRLNGPYLKLLATGRPWVIAKWAMTLDGKLATRSGDSKWISGEASRQKVHALRGRVDAILVGIGTVLADDPLLTARPPGPPGPRTATRIVLDSKGRLPTASQLVQTAAAAPVLLVATAPAPEELTAAGVDCLLLPPQDGRPGIGALLDELGRRRMTNVLVEGGSEVLGSFFDAGEVDEVLVFVAPKLFGGAAARSPVGGLGVERVQQALTLAHWDVEPMEEDVLIHGRRDW